ncbi:uncharacterized protein LOC112050090 isoform X2 [Bicyclus anynana]|uniref:Uncharacterized protein LOC112050090 isoform X2 n=1 Tax=Bicyclus anynana TaxID=110368 RepID=A0ABM3LJ06_BICAN|nr:uncharacterized protein LOC112050090 isoform X2 [Bicyclus anynana]
MMLHFISVAFNINTCFVAINKCLEDALAQIRREYIKITPTIRLAREVRKISNCFVRTCDVVRDLNDNDNFFLLVHLIVPTIYLVITINNMRHALVNETDTVQTVMLEIIWFLCHNYRVILLVQPCHRIKEEVLQTKLLVAQIMCEVTCEADPLFEASDTFLKQLLLNDVSFSVMGICSIGRPIISSVIGGATTLYVVMLEL